MFNNRYFELCIIMMCKIDSTIGNFLRAILFEIIAVSILASTALTIVGVPYSILIGVTAGAATIPISTFRWSFSGCNSFV